ncbi:UNVERIFIED_CONTAM: GerAB/ArcD/ProY family transporter [Halobacillus marinus]
MNTGSDKLTTPQTIALLGSMLVAVGIFTLPRALAEKVNTPDVWIPILIGGGITLGAGFLIIVLSLRFPEKHFFQYNQIITGRFIGTLISLLFISYTITLAAYEIRAMAELTQFYLLEDTPLSVIMISMLLVSIYLSVGGINPIARMFEFLYPITIFFFLMIILLGLKIFHIDNLRPVLGQGIGPVLEGISPTLLTFSGVEFMLVWIALMKMPKKAFQVVGWGVGVTVLLYLVTVVVVVGALSIDRTKIDTWPTFSLIQQYEYTGVFFERFDAVFLVVWLIQIFATYIACHYIAATGLAFTFKTKYKKVCYLLLPVVYLIALIPEDYNQMAVMGDYIGYSSIVFSMAIPALLLGIAVIRKQKGSG